MTGGRLAAATSIDGPPGIVEGSAETPRNCLLGALPLDDRALILEASRRIVFASGETLCESGDLPEAIDFIESGVISALVVMQTGQTVETCMIGREGATHAMLGLGQPSPARLVARIAGSGLRVEATRFSVLTAERPAIATVLGDYARRLISEVGRCAACNALHRTEERLARWLLRYRDRTDGDTLQLTQDLVAGALGAQRTTVNLAAQHLQRAGAIHYRRGVVRIVDHKALEHAACECYRPLSRVVAGSSGDRSSRADVLPAETPGLIPSAGAFGTDGR